PPVAVADTATTAEDTPATIAVLANDTDADGDLLPVAGVGAPAHGTTAINADKTITSAPAVNYNGADSFTYPISDGHGGNASAAVSITITPVNDPPVAANDTYTTNEDTTLTIPAVSGVLANDTDVDAGTTLTAVLVTASSRGSVVLNPNGGFTYTPGANLKGAASFTFKANYVTVDSNVATVSITVTAVNDAPVANPQAVTTTEDTAKAIVLAATDVDGDALTYAIVVGPAHGALSGTAPTVTYTPAA